MIETNESSDTKLIVQTVWAVLMSLCSSLSHFKLVFALLYLMLLSLNNIKKLQDLTYPLLSITLLWMF